MLTKWFRMALHLDAIGKAQWLFTKIKFFKQFEGRPIAQYSRKDYLTHRDRAFSLAKERIGHFNGFYGYKFNKINIKNQKTRWGSCSKKGNLNFNYKILFLSQGLSDYIIVHELCHLGEFNHSRKFWNLVAKTVPDYLKIKSELKKTGISFD